MTVRMSDEHKNRRRRTAAVQAGVGKDTSYQAVMPPLYLSSTYKIDGIDKRQPYEYSRTSNPTRDVLAEALTELEGGVGACVTSSGMAALTLILHLLEPEDLVLAPFDCYGRSFWLLRALAEKKHFKLKFIDQYDEAGLDEAFHEPPKMVLMETPSNPVMRIADIEAISKRAHEHSVIAKDQAILDALKLWNNSLGTIGAPFDSYQTLRGLRTLELRVHRAQENAIAVADFLNGHDKVARVYYPGLKTHAGFEIAEKQQEGPGAMISFELSEDKAGAFVEVLNVFCLAQSLGGTESLINHPASMTHVSMGEQARAKAGVTDALLRLSIGIEHVDDIIGDLSQALDAI